MSNVVAADGLNAVAAAAYLDLIKRCLTDSIFIDHPLANFVLYREKRTTPAWKRLAIRTLIAFLARYRIRLVEPYHLPWIPDYSERSLEEIENMREHGVDWPARAHTMIGMKRLDNIQYCVETAINDGVAGDLIETGVWRGGACIFMRAILKAYDDTTRTVWVADSFAGLPKPDAANYSADEGDIHHTYADFLAITREEVERNFRRYGLLDGQVSFLEGWFKDTLPSAPIRKLAVLRLDGDMYESTTQALDALYDKVSPGGFVIVDDYFLAPCRKAIHDFRDARGITDEIVDIDGMGVFWRRSA